jgi:hypothetical protein
MGPSLLGGQRNDGKYTAVLGVGAQVLGTFTQDTKCTVLSSNKGIWGGTIFVGITAWAQPGTIYVR